MSHNCFILTYFLQRLSTMINWDWLIVLILLLFDCLIGKSELIDPITTDRISALTTFSVSSFYFVFFTIKKSKEPSREKEFFFRFLLLIVMCNLAPMISKNCHNWWNSPTISLIISSIHLLINYSMVQGNDFQFTVN